MSRFRVWAKFLQSPCQGLLTCAYGRVGEWMQGQQDCYEDGLPCSLFSTIIHKTQNIVNNSNNNNNNNNMKKMMMIIIIILITWWA